ncbi:MAG TPA: transcription antitermination factor NusB [Myxococcota bacterium]|nr:transcription antitermination factor NusB [Myxococcota bacterium]
MPGLSPGRRAAAQALLAAESGKHAEIVGVAGRDLGLARHLVAGVLRTRGQLDAAISKLTKGRLDLEVQTALRIGLFELHRSRVPPHAAVDQAVQLVRVLRKARAAGLVNAVLRKAPPLPAVPNHPDWLVKRWTARYGDVSDWLARLDTEAPLALAHKPGVAMGGLRDTGVPDTGWLDHSGPIEEIEGYAEGGWWVMDPAAAMVADLVEARTGLRVLDACAAPGGKAMRLASQGATVLATDRSAARLERLRENLDRTRLEAEVRVVDWTRGAELGEFDAVLVDAPCTSLGTTRRHPEIRWSRLPTDPLAMAVLQDRILDGVCGHVRVGGRLVYAVCSPEPEEGSERIAAFVARQPGYVLETERCTAPPVGDEDAFYAAVLTKKS